MSEFAPYVKALEASELRERVLREQLIAAQARESKLREALKPFANIYLATCDLPPNFAMVVLQARKELAIPTDDSALQERLKIERDSSYAQALRDVREGKLT